MDKPIKIGPNHACFIIAEAGVNHNGDLNKALKLVDIAVEAGANAVKFQTFIPGEVVSSVAQKANYQKLDGDHSNSMLEMIKDLALPFSDFEKIQEHCKSRGIIFISSPFDKSSAEFLFKMGLEIIKLGSGELTNTPLLDFLAKKGKFLIISTGMSTLGEVDQAIQIMQNHRRTDFALLHCVSSYPAESKYSNLRCLDTLKQAFNIPVGYSDHHMGNLISFAAVARGACIIEKHFTENRRQKGPDHACSLEPNELFDLVQGIRSIESALGDGVKVPTECELDVRAKSRKSIVACREIEKGIVLDESMLKIKRPGTGIEPINLPNLLGRTTKKKIGSDQLINRDDLL
ncbi:MAG: N-acetylneuraminate synthase [Oligoflexales bacterium]